VSDTPLELTDGEKMLQSLIKSNRELVAELERVTAALDDVEDVARAAISWAPVGTKILLRERLAAALAGGARAAQEDAACTCHTFARSGTCAHVRALQEEK
jgi:hypothetical protein